MSRSMRTRPPGPKWYYECKFCFEEVEQNEARRGWCPYCGTFNSIKRLPMGKAGAHIPPGFAEGEAPPLSEEG